MKNYSHSQIIKMFSGNLKPGELYKINEESMIDYLYIKYANSSDSFRFYCYVEKTKIFTALNEIIFSHKYKLQFHKILINIDSKPIIAYLRDQTIVKEIKTSKLIALK